MNSYLDVSSEIAKYALTEIMKRYSSDGQTPKAYHNQIHTKSVIDNSKQLAKILNLNQKDTALIIIASAFHDYEHADSPDDELNSAEIASSYMRKYGVFSSEDIQRVVAAIFATKISFTTNKLQYLVNEDNLTKILADSDLSNLGSDEAIFIDCTYRLYDEVNMHTTWQEFVSISKILQAKHVFNLVESNELFPHKLSNTKILETLAEPTVDKV